MCCIAVSFCSSREKLRADIADLEIGCIRERKNTRRHCEQYHGGDVIKADNQFCLSNTQSIVVPVVSAACCHDAGEKAD